MGTQQLLLIVLGVIIVGIAIAVGITMFKGNLQSSNRDQVISDLENLGATAQQFYRKPTTMAGGGFDFDNFALTPVDTGDGNGSYSLASSQPSNADFVPGSITPVSSSTQSIYIVGCGKELGNNGTTNVKAYIEVTPDSLNVSILN